MDENSRTITDLADDVAKNAGDVAEDVTAKVSGRAARAREKAEEVIVEMKDEVSEIASKAGEGARHAAASGKDMACDALDGLAEAARQIAGKIDEGKGGNNAIAADYARKVAQGVERFSSRMKAKDVAEIADDARTVVRENPALVVGAAALVGFALARYLKGGSGSDEA